MCTVSWQSHAGQTSLLFNRDESRLRQPGLPPEIDTRQTIPLITPRDADAGGTWIAVNANGLIACLLNNYASLTGWNIVGERRSRGELPLLATAFPSTDSAAHVIALSTLGHYPPFLCLLVQPDHESVLLAWDGIDLKQENPDLGPQPVTTSGYEFEAVRAERRKARAHLADDTDWSQVRALHTFHAPDKPQFSYCMSRPDASTVSITEVSVTHDRVEMHYTPVRDGVLGLRVTATLPRNG